MPTHFLSSHRFLSALACAALLLALPQLALAADGTTQKEVINESTVVLEQLVQKAHDGKISPEQLRKQRIRVERTLDANLNNAPVAARAKEQVAVNQARTDLNQQIMSSQEFEFFGSEDRPEWGWYPSRHIQSTGSVVKVDQIGKAKLTPAKP